MSSPLKEYEVARKTVPGYSRFSSINTGHVVILSTDLSKLPIWYCQELDLILEQLVAGNYSAAKRNIRNFRLESLRPLLWALFQLRRGAENGVEHIMYTPFGFYLELYRTRRNACIIKETIQRMLASGPELDALIDEVTIPRY
jgi:hypothetical protein